jgi:Integrase zinc binding domain
VRRENAMKRRKECVPKSKRLEVLKEDHDTATAGHPEGVKMYKALRQGFYWLEMKREIEKYAQTCESCQKNKVLKRRKGGLLQLLVVSSRT